MKLNFFDKVRILDGGMGQELLSKGLVSKGTLWSASAILEKKYHNLVTDIHLSYINAGADVIVTNTFVGRKVRLIENKVEEHFNYINEQACILAVKAKEISNKDILIAGSLPSQSDTYVEDKRDSKSIERAIRNILLDPFTYQTRANEGRKHIINNFEWEKIAKS
mgnify:CR=1 FL=1